MQACLVVCLSGIDEAGRRMLTMESRLRVRVAVTRVVLQDEFGCTT